MERMERMEKGVEWKKEMERASLMVMAKICLGTKRENFSCLCPKLGGLKKNVISGPKWKFQFC